ncbi:oligosaccharide flippase family protein [Flavobacteriales bacterium]|jgi:O-antigen/teichoic acid export membrane protein|nr:oligosaccharide flippase family protein [Flavobacteriales bacterium]MDB2621916.1 oligosaccharide flippase family protein [Flavobacteriales bacterium]
MRKKFITNLLFLLVLNFLIKPFYILGIDAEIINRVGAETYGLYFSLFNFSFLFNIFLDFGINNFNTKNIAQNEHLLSKYFSKIFSLKLLLVVGYVLLILCAGFLWGYSEYDLGLLFILALNQGLVAIILYLRSNLGGSQMFFKDSIISVLDRFLMIVICSILLWGNITNKPFEIEWFVYAQTISYGITLLMALFWVWKKSTYVKIKFNQLFSMAIIRQSMPYALLILLMTFYYRSDSVMLEKMLDDGRVQAGYYAQAYRFFEAGNMVAYLFSVLLLPIFSKMIKARESIVDLVDISFKIMFSGALILSVLCFQFGDEIMSWRYHDISSQSSALFSVLMFCFVCISSTYIFGTLLTANGDLKLLNVLAGVAVMVNIGLNLILIPKWQALGSAVASLITQIIVSITQIMVSKKRFDLRITFMWLIQFMVFTLGVFLIAYFSHLHISNWVVAMLVFAVMSSILALIIRMIPLRRMIQVIKYE